MAPLRALVGLGRMSLVVGDALDTERLGYSPLVDWRIARNRLLRHIRGDTKRR